MGKFKNCCCGDACASLQVNAYKAHGGMAAFEAPWLGTWSAVDAENSLQVRFIEASILVITGRTAWPTFQTQCVCCEDRYLKIEFTGESTHVEDIGFGDQIVTASWRGSIQWSRATGFITACSFYADDGHGGGEQLAYSATLNTSTATYTVVDNSATAPTPYVQTAEDAGLGGTARITLAKDSADIEYTFVDSGHGLGETYLRTRYQMSEPYSVAECFGDAELMMDLLDLGNLATGDSTGTYVPLQWNREYNVAYSGWPNVVTVEENDQCAGVAFSPYIARLYGSPTEIQTALSGTDILSSPVGLPGRTLIMPTPPSDPVGPPTIGDVVFCIQTRTRQWVYTSKLRMNPAGQNACLWSLEQTPCAYTLPDGWTPEGEPNPYKLSGATSCDPVFYDAAAPVTTCPDSTSMICLAPDDLIFYLGMAVLYPFCVSGCASFNTRAACCNP